MVVKQISEKEVLEKIKNNERCILLIFESKDCVPDFNSEMHTGFDLKAKEEVILNEYQTKVVPTGCKWSAPSGYFIFVVPRSGLSLNTPLVIANSPGTVESSYRGDIGVILRICGDAYVYFEGYKDIKNLPDAIKIPKGTRLAQAIILRTAFVPHENIPIYYCVSRKLYVNWENINPSLRGSKGFGSTGI